MARTDNPILGEVWCIEPGCGGIEYVKQSRRRGGHLYGSCTRCGINQKTGEAAQARLAQYVPVGTLAGSSNPNEGAPVPAPGPVQEEPEPEPVPDPEPAPEPEPQQLQESEAGRRGKGGLWLIGFLVLLPLTLIGANTNG